MNEPPGARWRAGLTALAIAEHFRDDAHENVLLLIDNVYRLVQAGGEVSGLLGRLPSRVGYQPTLRSEEHTSELQSLMRISYAVFCLKKKHTPHNDNYKFTTYPQYVTNNKKRKRYTTLC